MYTGKLCPRRNPSQGINIKDLIQQRDKLGGQCILIRYGAIQCMKIQNKVK